MDKPKIRFQRANFVVADINKSLTFYRDVLGFEIAFEKVSEADSYSYDVFELPRKPMRFAVLSTDDQPRVMALTEIQDGLGYQEKNRRSAIVLEVPEIDKVVEQSKLLGLNVYHEDHLITNDGREGREIGIADFDGNLVVIYYITKAAI